MIKVVTLQHIYERTRIGWLGFENLVENELKNLEVKVEISITPENWAGSAGARMSVCKFAGF